MERYRKSQLAGMSCAMMLASCSVIDTPVSTASGFGVSHGSSISLTDEPEAANELNRRVRGQIEMELIRTGYRVEADSDYVLEFAIAKRPPGIGILLPEGETAQPEAGTWRSRPVDSNAFGLCEASIYRLMLVISRARTREIVFKGSSDDDICGQISDEKLKNMVAVSIARLHERAIP